MNKMQGWPTNSPIRSAKPSIGRKSHIRSSPKSRQSPRSNARSSRTAASRQQETDQLRKQIAELATQRADLQVAHEQNMAMIHQLADQLRQTSRRQEMEDVKQIVAGPFAPVENEQACRPTQTSDEEAARASHFADFASPSSNQEDSPRLPPVQPDSAAWHTPLDSESRKVQANSEPTTGASEQDRLMAQHLAEWEELLRTRSKRRKQAASGGVRNLQPIGPDVVMT